MNNSYCNKSQPRSFTVMITGQIESAINFPSNCNNLYCRYVFVYGPDWKVLNQNGSTSVFDVPESRDDGNEADVSSRNSTASSDGIEDSNREEEGREPPNSNDGNHENQNNLRSVSGITQISRRSSPNGEIVWNFPIDITFQSTNTYGWPRLCLSIYGPDWLNRDVVRGYGHLPIPISSENHKLYSHMYLPEAKSLWNKIMNVWNGTAPEYYDSRFTSQSKGREFTRVISAPSSSYDNNVATGACVKVVLDLSIHGMDVLGYDLGNS